VGMVGGEEGDAVVLKGLVGGVEGVEIGNRAVEGGAKADGQGSIGVIRGLTEQVTKIKLLVLAVFLNFPKDLGSNSFSLS